MGVFTFLKARGLEVGSSLVEEDKLDLARDLERIAKEKGVELILPSDIVLADNFDKEANTQIASATEIPAGWMGLDQGPKATEEIIGALSDCKTVIWNGPMGVFEFEKFAAGTMGVANALADLTGKGTTTIIGGGGASLELLEGKVLPGVAALNSAQPVAA